MLFSTQDIISIAIALLASASGLAASLILSGHYLVKRKLLKAFFTPLLLLISIILMNLLILAAALFDDSMLLVYLVLPLIVDFGSDWALLILFTSLVGSIVGITVLYIFSFMILRPWRKLQEIEGVSGTRVGKRFNFFMISSVVLLLVGFILAWSSIQRSRDILKEVIPHVEKGMFDELLR